MSEKLTVRCPYEHRRQVLQLVFVKLQLVGVPRILVCLPCNRITVSIYPSQGYNHTNLTFLNSDAVFLIVVEIGGGSDA